MRRPPLLERRASTPWDARPRLRAPFPLTVARRDSPPQRSLQRERPDARDRKLGLSPPFAEARLDEFVHLPRDGSDIEQSLDALASGAGKLGAPVGRIQQLAERRRNAIGVARFDRHRAGTADLGQAAPPRGDERGAARHRFQRRSAERFGAGRQHHSDFGALPRRLDLGIGNVGIDPDPAVERLGGGAKRVDQSPAPGRRPLGRTP